MGAEADNLAKVATMNLVPVIMVIATGEENTSSAWNIPVNLKVGSVLFAAI